MNDNENNLDISWNADSSKLNIIVDEIVIFNTCVALINTMKDVINAVYNIIDESKEDKEIYYNKRIQILMIELSSDEVLTRKYFFILSSFKKRNPNIMKLITSRLIISKEISDLKEDLLKLSTEMNAINIINDTFSEVGRIKLIK